MKNPKLFLIACFVSLAALASCGKELLPPAEAAAELYAELGAALTIRAGEEDWYQSTEVIQDELGVYEFQAVFRRADCEVCAERLTVTLRDRVVRAEGEATNPDSAFATGERAFRGQNPVSQPEPNAYRFSVSAEGQAPFTYEWGVAGQTLSRAASPIFHLPNPEVVELHLTDATGCERVLRRHINPVVSATAAPDCRFFIQQRPVANTERVVDFRLQGESLPDSTLRYFWNFGDGRVARTRSPLTRHRYEQDGLYVVGVTVVRVPMPSIPCIYIDEKEIAVGPSAPRCNAAMRYGPVANDLETGTVTLEYISSDGTRYTTDPGTARQPEDAYFHILESADYDDTPEGLPARRLVAETSCVLFNAQNPEDAMEVELGDLAVALRW